MSIYEHFSPQELEILRARAERAAHAAQKSDAETLITALQITPGSESYALPLELLHGVYEGIEVVPVPCTPPFIAGIANVRGRILPVLDLATLLGVPEQARPETHALVVVSNTRMTVSFSVGTIGEVISFVVSTMATPSNYLRGVLPDGTGLLDVDAILDDPRLIVAETFSS